MRIQANALRDRLLLRGYSCTNLRKAFNKTLARSRSTRTILSNHWHLLTEHKVLSRHVRSAPELVFHRAPSLRDRLTNSHYSPTQRPKSGPNSTLKCGVCPRCPWILEGRKFQLSNGESLSPRTFSNCGTKGVIYLMVCKCQVFYVGKTIRELSQCIGDHLY